MYTRPNTGVGWYERTSEYATYVQSNYFDNGKIENKQETVSENGLTKQVVITWESPNDWVEWMDDVNCQDLYRIPRDAYNSANSINLVPGDKDVDPL